LLAHNVDRVLEDVIACVEGDARSPGRRAEERLAGLLDLGNALTLPLLGPVLFFLRSIVRPFLLCLPFQHWAPEITADADETLPPSAVASNGYQDPCAIDVKFASPVPSTEWPESKNVALIST